MAPGGGAAPALLKDEPGQHGEMGQRRLQYRSVLVACQCQVLQRSQRAQPCVSQAAHAPCQCALAVLYHQRPQHGAPTSDGLEHVADVVDGLQYMWY